MTGYVLFLRIIDKCETVCALRFANNRLPIGKSGLKICQFTINHKQSAMLLWVTTFCTYYQWQCNVHPGSGVERSLPARPRIWRLSPHFPLQMEKLLDLGWSQRCLCVWNWDTGWSITGPYTVYTAPSLLVGRKPRESMRQIDRQTDVESFRCCCCCLRNLRQKVEGCSTRLKGRPAKCMWC